MKAAPCLPCLNTLPCCRGTAGRPSSSFSSGTDLPVWRAGKSRFLLLGPGGPGHCQPEGAVIAEQWVKSCLLRPDFVSVDLWGEVHLDPAHWTLPSTAKGMASRRRGCD